MIETFKKVFNLDFYGQTTAPVNPPAGSARMFYDSATGAIVVIDSTGKNLLASGTFAGTRAIAEVQVASVIDFYGQQAAPENPSTGLARAYYDSVTDDFAVIDSQGTVLLGTGSSLSGHEVEVSGKVHILDFLGLTSAPSNPPAGFARMYYNSQADTFNVIDSTGKSLLTAVPPPTPPVFIASIEAISGTNSITGQTGGASTIDTTGATLLVACVRANGSTPTITDSAGNTWVYGTEFINDGSICHMRVAYVVNPVTSATHSFTPSAAEGSADIFAFSGGSGWVLDTEAGGGATGTSTTPSITPAGINEVIVVSIGSNAGETSGTVNNGFTGGQGVGAGDALPQKLSGSPEVGMGAYLIYTSASAINAEFTASPNNSDFNPLIAAFKTS